ncbi:putative Major facilitator superfamily (MFS) profile domain-containing protein [Seiridium cardinale]|uniref:Major facilitator superfamily (MFS) profile domain-containing protein n=1 Tax=Seiridium cardinale TaxID=138064 RepID=A0ABR2XFJ8_9PEZI
MSKKTDVRVDVRALEEISREFGVLSAWILHALISKYDLMKSTTEIPTRNISHENPTIVVWDEGDIENPSNWSNMKKWFIIFIAMVLTTNSTMGSTLPSMAMPYIAKEWDVGPKEQAALPTSIYLVGYVMGPLTWGPLSEHVGRRGLTIISLVFYNIWTLACAFAPSWTPFLIFRLLAGIAASSPIAIAAGIIADLYDDPVTRGRAFAFFSASTCFGPLLGPIVAGFCSEYIGWRWAFRIVLIFAGVSCLFLFWLPETYAPVLLARRARKIRKESPGVQAYAAAELEQRDFKQLATVVLTRPIRMLCTELIVISSCMYLALVYGIFYLSFQSFPLIFEGLYGFTPAITGLCFLPVGVGAMLALPIMYLYDTFLSRSKAQGKSWTSREEYRRLPLAFIGGPMYAVSLFWLGWSANSSISFAAPLLAGLPLGCGYMLIFIALLNYLTDAYPAFAASANAASTTTRSVFAVVLPVATTSMFQRLQISGACSVLGGLSTLMCIIPVIFIWKSDALRAHSRFGLELEHKGQNLRRGNDVEMEPVRLVLSV